MDQKTVLVTGIGGNVGQGILRNIRALKFNIRCIGINVKAFSAGNHLVDTFYQVPFYDAPDYIACMQKIVADEKVDLIIPSTDYESNKLAQHRKDFSCPIATSDYDTSCIYLDKYKSYLHHKAHNIPFAESALPSTYQGEFKSIIVKGREGRGSRDLHFNPAHPEAFPDTFMVQELLTGTEITTAFYVTKSGKLHGFINFERELVNGTTQECRVAQQYDAHLAPILQQLIAHTKIKGSANMQSIVCDDGRIVPFEINCRISGTNSIRANFGFEDVKYTLEEYLYQHAPSQPKITSGTAVRILMDVIYPNTTDSAQLKDQSANHYLF